MKILILCMLIVIPLRTHAMGVVTIEGLLTSNTPSKCAIETKSQIFYLLKKNLSSAQIQLLKPGKVIALTLPFSSIDQIREK